MRAHVTVVLFLLLCLVGLFPAAHAQPVGSTPLFADDALLELTLAADLKPILRDREEDRPAHPALLTYRTSGGAVREIEVWVRTRGHYRLHRLGCDVPPLRFDFRGVPTEGTPFEGQGRVKLVTHCQDGSAAYEQRVLQEYLIYRAYNLLTDFSFRVRLVRLTYVDTARRRRPVTHFAFLIEDDDDVAKRNSGRILDGIVVHPEAAHRELTTLMAVFQYMIGNSDWGVTTRHNIKTMAVKKDGALVALPYDFDWAGLVDAPYAVPDPKLGLRSVRERLFMGFCRSEAEFDAAFARFHKKRPALTALFRDFPHLDPKVAARSAEYLDAFFDALNDPKAVRRAFHGKCLEAAGG